MNTPLARQFRASVACGEWQKPTSGQAPGFTQANVVILPEKYAFDFLLFCQRNEQPCPVIDVCESGVTALPFAAPGADIRNEVPRYRIYRHGELECEPDNILNHFTNGLVTFLLGCSFTFEQDLLNHGIPVRHIELERNVPMYITNRECRPAGVFSGPMVVSMRPIPENLVDKAAAITARYRKAHGAPIHVGIAVERPESAIDGHRYSMRGEMLDDLVPAADRLLEPGFPRPYATIAIGDGGNELGLGSLRQALKDRITHGELIFCATAADHVIPAGISNWGAFALVATLSLLTGQRLLRPVEHEHTVLEALVGAGAVDGCTRKNEISVDGIAWPDYANIIAEIYREIETLPEGPI